MEKAQLQTAVLNALSILKSELDRSMHRGLKARLPVCDVVQETYSRVLEKMERFEYRGTASLYSWLREIARNVIREKVRKRSSTNLGDLAESLWESGLLRPSEISRKKEDCEHLRSAILKLPKHHQDVLRKHYVDLCSFEEISRETGKASADLRGLHRNAIAKLRRLLNVGP